MIIDGKEIAVSEEERIVEALLKDFEIPNDTDNYLLVKRHLINKRWIKIVRKVLYTH